MQHLIESINWGAVGESLLITWGVCCFVGAGYLWWQRTKAKYESIFVYTGNAADVEEREDDLVIDEQALRRMMKQTAKEMDWTKVRWR